MRTSGNFKDILRQLEEGSASQKVLNKLETYVKCDNVYEPVFRDYISKRLKDNIHPERLLQLAYNMERSDSTKFFSRSINEQLTHSITVNGENYDQFYFMNRHDTRSDNHIFKAMLEKLGRRLDDNTIEVIEKIAEHTKENKYNLILQTLDNTEFYSFRAMMFMDKLSAEDQYMLLTKGFENNNSNVLRLMRAGNPKLQTHLDQKIVADGDKDALMSAIRNTLIPIEELEVNDFLYYIAQSYSDELPETLESLYVKAEQKGRYEYMLSVCKHKNKKDVLRTICKANDKELIDRFFSIYKNSPEVKHLVPFL